jgi:hypothetical protein
MPAVLKLGDVPLRPGLKYRIPFTLVNDGPTPQRFRVIQKGMPNPDGGNAVALLSGYSEPRMLAPGMRVTLEAEVSVDTVASVRSAVAVHGENEVFELPVVGEVVHAEYFEVRRRWRWRWRWRWR